MHQDRSLKVSGLKISLFLQQYSKYSWAFFFKSSGRRFFFIRLFKSVESKTYKSLLLLLCLISSVIFAKMAARATYPENTITTAKKDYISVHGPISPPKIIISIE
jgi:hypothetical protein